MNALESTSTRPYLIRALYEWCTDNGLTPYVAVAVDDSVQVPREYVKNNEIVLNISYDATSALTLGNDFIGFKARFAGTAREIMVPMARVIAIYARENGQGMAFPLGQPGGAAPVDGAEPLAHGAEAAQRAPGSGAPRPVAVAPRMHAVPQPAAAASEDAGNVVQLMPHDAVDTSGADASVVDGADGGDGEPPRPGGSGGSAARPALKRIK